MKGVLVLSDGSIYYGHGFGAEGIRVGEVVFNTSMTGYQEALTDPSYAGQILILTYPLIGNYGINKNNMESDKIHVRGLIVREVCEHPEHFLSEESLDEFLKKNNIPGVYGLDTRAIVRKIRGYGVLPGCVCVYEEEVDIRELIEKARRMDYSAINFVEEVSSKEERIVGEGKKSVVLVDCGVKRSIIRELLKRDVRVIIVPHTTDANKIKEYAPDGVVISNGPGDPANLLYIANNIRKLFNKFPIFGICLGNQILGYAGGAKTYKLKFGHRSSNQPVKDTKTGKVYITTQNHGFAIDPSTLSEEFTISYINCNDNTIEGIEHKELPLFSVQFHPEANPGPYDSVNIFDKFVSIL